MHEINVFAMIVDITVKIILIALGIFVYFIIKQNKHQAELRDIEAQEREKHDKIMEKQYDILQKQNDSLRESYQDLEKKFSAVVANREAIVADLKVNFKEEKFPDTASIPLGELDDWYDSVKTEQDKYLDERIKSNEFHLVNDDQSVVNDDQPEKNSEEK